MPWVTHNQASLFFFAPEILLSVSAVILLFLSTIASVGRTTIGLIAFLVFGVHLLLATVLLLHPEVAADTSMFSGMIALDSFAAFFKVFFACVGTATLAMAMKSPETSEQGTAETAAFLMTLTVGMSLMAAATDLLMMYLALETVSVLSYILVGARRHHRASAEAGLKYILYGAAASGVMIFGMSYLFGLAGGTDLRTLSTFFRNLHGIALAPVTFFALICVMTGLAFKIATFPAHMWCPDVYEGAPTPVTAFLSVGPKAAGFAMAARFFLVLFGLPGEKMVEIFSFINWPLVLAVLAAITMTLGNLTAIPQRNIKRLMAYSSIGHAGYLLMGLATFTSQGLGAVLFYLIVYGFMNFGAFLIISAVADRLGTEEIDGYRGLGWQSPWLAIPLTVFLFSLTGLPPFAGFIGKYLLFAAVIRQGIYWLAIVAVLNSVISLFFYARIIRAMYLDTPLSEREVRPGWFYGVYAALCAIPTLVLGLYWEPLAAWAGQSAQSLF